MPTPTYAEVLRLAEQLTPDEQRALAARLQVSAARTQMSAEEWMARFEALIVTGHKPGPNLSFSREDWYDDDGR